MERGSPNSTRRSWQPIRLVGSMIRVVLGRRSLWLDRRSPTWLLRKCRWFGFYESLNFHPNSGAYRLSIYIYRYVYPGTQYATAVIHAACGLALLKLLYFNRPEGLIVRGHMCVRLP